MIKIVFDIDDTISVHENRDYRNAIPKLDVIEKLNYLHDVLEYEIELFTARGMISCNGDIEKIVEKNKAVLEEWLYKHNVHYDILTFGKPIADMYIDDKCMSVNEFLNQEFCLLKGGSGKPVNKIGNIVKKQATLEKIELTKRWSKEAAAYCNTPHIISSVYDTLYMDYIDGISLCHLKSFDELLPAVLELFNTINKFKDIKQDSFDIRKLVMALQKHKSDNEYINSRIYKCINLLYDNEKLLEANATFCHGDLTLSNVIQHFDTMQLYYIDPEMNKQASSYLLDYAKLRMSLMGYERNFDLTTSRADLKTLKKMLDANLRLDGIYDIVVILNYMWVLRLWNYKQGIGKDIVIQMIKELEEENESIFKA